MRRSCITDMVDFEESKIRFCIVCLIQIIEKNEILKKFKLKEKFRNDYLYL